MSDTWTISESAGNFIPVSAGMQAAVVKRVSEPFWEVNKFSDDGEEIEFFNVTYEVNEETPDGEKMTCRRKYRKSLHQKSNFRKDLIGILGRDISAEERKDFAPNSIEGMACQVLVEHTPRKDDPSSVWANITKVMAAKAA